MAQKFKKPSSGTSRIYAAHMWNLFLGVVSVTQWGPAAHVCEEGEDMVEDDTRKRVQVERCRCLQGVELVEGWVTVC